MRTLQSYINESFGEGFKNKVSKLLSRFKKTEEESSKETGRYKEWDDLIEFVVYKDENGNYVGSTMMSVSDIRDIVKERMKFKDASKFTYDNKIQDTIAKAALTQAMIDYAYLNYTGGLKKDPFGEAHGEEAYQRVCKEFDQDDRKISAGYFGLPVLSVYPYGWSTAERINLKISNRWIVDFKTGEPKI